jgi:hypothetical protein
MSKPEPPTLVRCQYCRVLFLPVTLPAHERQCPDNPENKEK